MKILHLTPPAPQPTNEQRHAVEKIVESLLLASSMHVRVEEFPGPAPDAEILADWLRWYLAPTRRLSVVETDCAAEYDIRVEAPR